MAWDNVPWAVGGGAQHSSEVARLAAFVATGGQTGVLGPTDLAVLPLTSPGAGFRVLPGACVIRNRAANASSDSYLARMPSQETISPVTGTTSSTRSDLICARVENPFISGEPWSIPQDVTVGPYIFTRVIQNVPGSTKSVDQLGLGYTAATLARVDWPANTSTITGSMIKDLRSVVNQHSAGATQPAPDSAGEGGEAEAPNWQYVLCPSSGPEQGGDYLYSTHTTFVDWPVAATWPVTFPKWCTHITFDLEVKNVQVNNGDAWGEIVLVVNGVAVKTSVFDFNLQVVNNGIRQWMAVGGEYQIPKNLRGKTVTFRIRAKMYSASRTSGCFIRANSSTYTAGHIFFSARPVLD